MNYSVFFLDDFTLRTLATCWGAGNDDFATRRRLGIAICRHGEFSFQTSCLSWIQEQAKGATVLLNIVIGSDDTAGASRGTECCPRMGQKGNC
jgi:hypothetical protein